MGRCGPVPGASTMGSLTPTMGELMDEFTERQMRWAIDRLSLNNAVLEAAVVELAGAASEETRARVLSAMQAAADDWRPTLTAGTVDAAESQQAKSIIAGALSYGMDRAAGAPPPEA